MKRWFVSILFILCLQVIPDRVVGGDERSDNLKTWGRLHDALTQRPWSLVYSVRFGSEEILIPSPRADFFPSVGIMETMHKADCPITFVKHNQRFGDKGLDAVKFRIASLERLFGNTTDLSSPEKFSILSHRIVPDVSSDWINIEQGDFIPGKSERLTEAKYIVKEIDYNHIKTASHRRDTITYKDADYSHVFYSFLYGHTIYVHDQVLLLEAIHPIAENEIAPPDIAWMDSILDSWRQEILRVNHGWRDPLLKEGGKCVRPEGF